MLTNIFLTGERGAGKTTIIKKAVRALDIDPGGFMTGCQKKDGYWVKFFLVDARKFIYQYNSFYRESITTPDPQTVFADRGETFSYLDIRPEVFDHCGVELLESGYRAREIVIMDELGRFERKAALFRAKVKQILNSRKPVLGVLKKADNFFLNSIKKRPGVDLYTVNKENRDDIYRQVYDGLSRLMN